MRQTVKRTIAFLGATCVAAQLFIAIPANASPFRSSSTTFEQAMPVTPPQKEVGRLFKQINANALTVGQHADKLDSFTRLSSRFHPTTHATELNRAKEAINSMGADYRKLLELRPSALPWQQSVIDQMEPVLIGLAGRTTDAIALLNEGHGAISSAEYRDAVGSLQGYAGETRTLLSVNLNYAQAREKLNQLNGAPEPEVEAISSKPELDVISSRPVKTLEQQVRSELLKLPYYGVFDHLAFQVDGDEVVLTGEVTWPTLKADAERVIEQMEGVSSVTSDIKVLPLSSHDDSLRKVTYWAIYGQPTMTRYRLNPNPPIRIIVENGHVTLKGVVGSEMDRTIANLQANSVPGAFSVTNNLQVGS